MSLKRTPLFAAHQRLGGKLIEFGGWEMPVQYSSIVDEHLAVRRAAGIFDISHMGEICVSGPSAEAFLNRTLTNDIRKIAVGQGQYTLMCNERGGVVDDLYVYRLGDEEYLLIVNASRIAADWDWLQEQYESGAVAGEIRIKNASDEFSAVAIQGPRVVEFINNVVPGGSISGTFVTRATDLKKNELGAFVFDAATIYVARTGYTGEDGFEIIAPTESIEAVWARSLAVGHQGCLQPAGLGARDTLRTEVCYPLYGHELDENTTPIEAGVGFFVALDKGDFVGRSVLAEQKANGTKRKLVAFKMTERSAPPRPHYPIWANGSSAGEVVSGTQSPSLNVGIGLGYVPPQLAKAGTKIEIEIRGQRAPAEVVPKPIYRKAG
ncbi:MAG TPA: glycine cleavage system aminomethyltransferase GcvT [Methylomirabilota bacterium]|nr:glycine cleavage system aminomethyltransferase GcvT [Methylomirabilota bacterium]